MIRVIMFGKGLIEIIVDLILSLRHPWSTESSRMGESRLDKEAKVWTYALAVIIILVAVGLGLGGVAKLNL